METFCALLALCSGKLPVTGEVPAQRPVARNFDVFFDLRLNKHFSKQSWGWWFETPSCPLWRHCNVKPCRDEPFLRRLMVSLGHNELSTWGLRHVVEQNANKGSEIYCAMHFGDNDSVILRNVFGTNFLSTIVTFIGCQKVRCYFCFRRRRWESSKPVESIKRGYSHIDHKMGGDSERSLVRFHVENK